jgi:uncharacterized protein (TIGR03435 family)
VRPLLCLLAATLPILSGQTFEAASVKVGVPFPGRPELYILQGGGTGTATPGEFQAKGAPLLNLILRAYSLKSFQVASSPALQSDRYDIVARVPAGATAAQVSVMLQHLLVERIGLAVHHETRPGPVYEMVVAKDGLKMKRAEGAAGDSASITENGMAPGLSLNPDDTLRLAPGYPNTVLESIDASTMRIAGRMQSMAGVMRVLERPTGRTILDKTGLGGLFDFDFLYTRPAAVSDTASDPAEDFFAALQAHLGLKLVAKTGPMDVLVVDRWNKTPVEN